MLLVPALSMFFVLAPAWESSAAPARRSGPEAAPGAGRTVVDPGGQARTSPRWVEGSGGARLPVSAKGGGRGGQRQAPLPARRSPTVELFLLHYDTGELYAFHPEERRLRYVGATGLADPAALCEGPDGELYTFTTAGHLWRIDASNAAATPLGNLGLSSVFEGALAIEDTGRAIGASEGNGLQSRLFELDLTNAQARVLGSIGIADVNGLAFRDDGQLVALDRVHNAFYVIDPDTLDRECMALVVPLVGAAGGMTVRDGRGYFVTGGTPGTFGGSHELWSFDPYSGEQRFELSLPPALDGVGVAGLCFAGGEEGND